MDNRQFRRNRLGSEVSWLGQFVFVTKVLSLFIKPNKYFVYYEKYRFRL
ncbi:hypothetical protein CLV60_10148 [Dyadobacter jiangsuensis]|uniref:Uncharacterized protein n=1 Tax=Dyadobacter jiangsuensis TaxID=1591085 RepID=A0A2P8GI81_9BACT|nr:hypothetical protein CLV60_10148 [Dyadobacter jiangsuensis]